MHRCRSQRRAIANLVLGQASRGTFRLQAGSTSPYIAHRQPHRRSGFGSSAFVFSSGWTAYEKWCYVAVSDAAYPRRLWSITDAPVVPLILADRAALL